MPKVLLSTKGTPVLECPACGNVHVFDKDRWQWNGDMEKPTFAPSMLVNGSLGMAKYVTESNPRCHSFVEDGVWKFLTDCSHKMAGQKVACLEMEQIKFHE